MSKPLELVIYTEYHGSYSRQRIIDGVNHITFHKPHDGKRLTDAELAAEYWRANALGWMHEDAGEFTRAAQHAAESNTLHRFATLPHYDEVPA